MLSCARATRGLRRPSLDTRSGRPSSPPSREKVEERWSLDARSGAYARPIAEKDIREQMFDGRSGTRHGCHYFGERYKRALMEH